MWKTETEAQRITFNNWDSCPATLLSLFCYTAPIKNNFGPCESFIKLYNSWKKKTVMMVTHCSLLTPCFTSPLVTSAGDIFCFNRCLFVCRCVRNISQKLPTDFLLSLGGRVEGWSMCRRRTYYALGQIQTFSLVSQKLLHGPWRRRSALSLRLSSLLYFLCVTNSQ